MSSIDISRSQIPAAIAGVTRSDPWMWTKLYQQKCSATAQQCRLTRLLNPVVFLVNRRTCYRVVRFSRSMNAVEIYAGSGLPLMMRFSTLAFPGSAPSSGTISVP
jgi:hypothetical protein